MKRTILFAVLFSIFYHCYGQESFLLWDEIPNAISDVDYKEMITPDDFGVPFRLSQVSTPILKAYIVPKELSTGTAVLICPGGGYRILAINHEGDLVAKWLNRIGISAFVLKYRLPEDRIMIDKRIGPLQDAQEGLRFIRRNALKWNINPNKIGVLGFSAGGHLAASLSTHYNQKVYDLRDDISARPDFSILIYPVISMKNEITHQGSRLHLLGENPTEEDVNWFSNENHVNENTPPTFLVHSFDDRGVSIENSLIYATQLKANRVPVELHAYRSGGHGYGLGKEDTHQFWNQACAQWLEAMGCIPHQPPVSLSTLDRK